MFLYPTYGNISPPRYTQTTNSPVANAETRSETPMPVNGSDSSANSGFRDTGQRLSISGRDSILTYATRNGESVRVQFNDGSFFVGTFFDSRV